MAGGSEGEGGKRPYKGTPRFSEAGERAERPTRSRPPTFESFAPPAEGGTDRPRFERRERPSFGDKPGGFKKSFKKEGFKSGGFKTGGFKSGTGGFKKKYVGKAAGAKGSYKGGKAFREKSR